MQIVILAIITVIILIFIFRKEQLEVITEKVAPQTEISNESIRIDAIPLVDEENNKPIQTDQKPHVALTYDAANARNALARSRDKRVFDAIANRTANYWRPIFEQELAQCEKRDWWDDVAYPMNDSGETAIVPEKDYLPNGDWSGPNQFAAI